MFSLVQSSVKGLLVKKKTEVPAEKKKVPRENICLRCFEMFFQEGEDVKDEQTGLQRSESKEQEVFDELYSSLLYTPDEFEDVRGMEMVQYLFVVIEEEDGRAGTDFV